jgi:hypothetical protein
VAYTSVARQQTQNKEILWSFFNLGNKFIVRQQNCNRQKLKSVEAVYFTWSERKLEKWIEEFSMCSDLRICKKTVWIWDISAIGSQCIISIGDIEVCRRSRTGAAVGSRCQLLSCRPWLRTPVCVSEWFVKKSPLFVQGGLNPNTNPNIVNSNSSHAWQ